MKTTDLIKMRIEELRKELKSCEVVCNTTKIKDEFEIFKEKIIYCRGALNELENLLDDLE